MSPIARLRYDAVIFDMDGVLIDSEPISFAAMREVLAPYGVPYDEGENEEFLGRSTLDTFATLVARHRVPAVVDDLVDAFTVHKVGLLRTRGRPMPGVPAVLERVRAAGYRTALASSAEHAVIDVTTEVLGIRALFEVLVSGREVPRAKPAPDVFLETARRLGAPPARCLVVEDSRNGLLAAKAAGMNCAVVPCAYTAGQDFREADFRLGSLDGLPPLL